MEMNHWDGIGKLASDPVLTEPKGKKQVHFTLVTNRRVQDASGQWVDQPISVPCYAFDKRAEAIAQHCSEGQEVGVEAYYRSWPLENDQLGHGMIILSISFGYKPKGQQKTETIPDNIPM